MRLATLATDDGSKAVVVRDGGAVPVDGYGDVGALLQDGDAGLAAARAAATARRGRSTTPGCSGRCSTRAPSSASV